VGKRTHCHGEGEMALLKMKRNVYVMTDKEEGRETPTGRLGIVIRKKNGPGDGRDSPHVPVGN